MNALLTVDDLHVRFSKGEEALVHALNGACLQVREREVVGILGESGSGKSTLAKCLLRLLARNAMATGMIQFEGKNLLWLSESEMNAHSWSADRAQSEMPAVLEAVGVTESSAF